jgi:hypothetical protein
VKAIKVENEDISKAICSGDSYIQIGDRKFLLLEVDQIREPNVYEVTDSEEEEQLLHALEYENPVLSGEEIKRILDDQK